MHIRLGWREEYFIIAVVVNAITGGWRTAGIDEVYPGQKISGAYHKSEMKMSGSKEKCSTLGDNLIIKWIWLNILTDIIHAGTDTSHI